MAFFLTAQFLLARVCCEPRWSCWTVLGESTGGLLVIPKWTCCCLLCNVSPDPQPPFPNFAVNSHYVSLCTVSMACTGVAQIHHRRGSACSQLCQPSFLWQGQWPIALRDGWYLQCSFFPLLRTPLFPSSLSLCVDGHTSGIVFMQILYSHSSFLGLNYLGAL